MSFSLTAFCSTAGRSGSQQEALPFRLTEKLAQAINDRVFFVADIDRDGQDDLLTADSVACIWFSIKGTNAFPTKECNFRWKGSVIGNFDATGDGRPECFVEMQRPEGVLVSCYDWFCEAGPSTPIYTLGPYLPPIPRNNVWGEGRVDILNCFDADRNGRPEVYAGINAFQAAPSPRSLYAYDGPTGQELWHFDVGPIISAVGLVEQAGREPRIVVSTFAPANGAEWNGTSDDIAYLLSLTPRGELDWALPLSGELGSVWAEIVDLERDGRPDLLVCRYLGDQEVRALSGREDVWSLAVLNPVDGRMERSVSLQTGIRRTLSGNTDQDVELEVAAIGTDGRFFILDGDLSADSVVGGPPHRWIHGIVDLDGDGQKEIVCSGLENIMVRDSRGRLLAQAEADAECSPCLAFFGGKPYIAARRESGARFYALEKQMIAVPRGGLAPLGVGACLGGAAVLGGFALRNAYRRHQSALAVSDETKENLLQAMVAFGHGGSSMKILDRLRFHLKNWDRRLTPGDGSHDPVPGIRQGFVESVIPDLHRIVFLARKAGVQPVHWKSVVKNANDGTRNLRLATHGEIRGSADTGRRFARAALASLDNIDAALAGIREYLRQVFHTHLLVVVNRVLADRAQDLDKMAVASQLQVIGALEDSAFVAQTTFEKVFSGALDNALRAMEGTGNRRLDVRIEEEGSYVRIDVRDSGCGIPESDWERVFDRQFSTKPGGGFGLFYAREDLAKFGGKMFVHSSTVGEGTTFRIILRRSR